MRRLVLAGLFWVTIADAKPLPQLPPPASAPHKSTRVARIEPAPKPNPVVPNVPAPEPPKAVAPAWSPQDEVEPSLDGTTPGNSSEPAMQYGALDAATCLKQVALRGIAHRNVEGGARGVLAPIRLDGTVRGVSFHSVLPVEQRKTSVFEIVDCRLALALDDFARILQKHDIVEVVHMSVYRPPPTRGWKEGAQGTRHSGALAIDVGAFIKKDGTRLVVEKDYHGYIGQHACTQGPWPITAESLELRQLTCEIIGTHLFHVVLTPGFNWAHRNHFHLEVSANGKHYYVR